MATAQETLEKILNAKGNHVSIRYRSFPTPAKAKTLNKGVTLEKETKGAFRAGISYRNMKRIREAIEAGERGEVGPLWHGKGVWLQHPYIATHVDKGGEYLWLAPAVGDNQRPKVVYRVNGNEVTKDVFESYLTESDKNKSKEDLDGFHIHMENLLDLEEA